jgi:polysaccharide pyruvyl transferase WcaK-like protein
VLNIGGGSTYPWENRPETLVGDADENFVRLMLETCRLTTARDPLTQKLFRSLGYETEVICCPAILAGKVYTTTTAPTRKVVINYMEGGGHYDWGQGIDNVRWQKTMCEVVRQLRDQRWDVVLLAHDDKEYKLARRIWPDLPCENPISIKNYFEFVRDACFGVFNRMHASVAAAGLGVPSVAIGTDARNLMVAQTGLPVFYVQEASAELLLRETRRFEERRQSEANRLLDLQAKTQRRYEELLAPFVLP